MTFYIICEFCSCEFERTKAVLAFDLAFCSREHRDAYKNEYMTLEEDE